MNRLPMWGWAGIVLVVVLAFNAFLTPNFFQIEVRDGRLYGSLVDVFNRSAPVAILAMGMTLVIATGGVDLSVGAIIAIAGSTAAGLISRPTGTPFAGGSPIPNLAVPAALAAGLGAGLFNGFLIAVLEFQPIVATLLLMVAGRGIAQLLANGQIVTFVEPGFASLGRGAFLGLPNPIWMFVATLIVCSVLTRWTAFGLFLEATGNNERAAKYIGINAKGIKCAVYAISGICASIAGLILTADIQAADANNAGLYLELDAILAVSVGGTALSGGRFSLVGSMIGALLMQTVTTTILTRGVSPETTLVLKAAIVVLVCLLQSSVIREKFAKRSPKAA